MTARKRFAVLAAALVLVGCGDDPEAPALDMADVAGDYRATTLRTIVAGQTTDHLAAGATLEITLLASGQTTGRFYVPGGDEDGSDYEADLAGTWTLRGNVVEFSHQSDTFVRDVEFRAEPGRLSADEVVSGTRIVVVLEKQ